MSLNFVTLEERTSGREVERYGPSRFERDQRDGGDSGRA